MNKPYFSLVEFHGLLKSADIKHKVPTWYNQHICSKDFPGDMGRNLDIK